MTDEEHRMKNDVKVDYGHNWVVPQPHFSLLSSSSYSNFTKSFQCLKASPFPQPPSRLFIGNKGTWLVCSSPRWATASTWSNLACPGELVTSPLSHFGGQVPRRLAWASQGSEKALEWPFCPPIRVFSAFFIETSNNLPSYTATSVEQLNSTRENQNIGEW